MVSALSKKTLLYGLTLKDHHPVDGGAFHIVLQERGPQEGVVVPGSAPPDLQEDEGNLFNASNTTVQDRE